MLLQTRRYKDAEAALRQALAEDPNYARAHALLALALYRQDRDAEALQQAQNAVGLAPDESFNHYMLALALLALDRVDEGETAITEALRLDPEDPDYHATSCNVYIQRKDWPKALKAAETGLRFDPEHVQCTNLQGMALVKLGRKDEAGKAIAKALARDPENALTHANQGWALLHRGEQEQAFVHFREALRLDPMSGWARAGIVEALKARNIIYRLMLRYFLWMSALTSEEQAGVIGSLVAFRMAMSAIASGSCLLQILFLPLDFLYRLFAALSWTARPFFALLLRFDRLGRLALPREEIVASNWLALCLLSAGGSAIAGLVLRNITFLVPLLLALSMIVPVAGTSQCPAGSHRAFLIAYTVLLAQLAIAVSALALTGALWGLGLAIALALVFVFLRMLYTWLAFILLSLGE